MSTFIQFIGKKWKGIFILVAFFVAMHALPWFSPFAIGLLFTLIIGVVTFSYVMEVRLTRYVRNYIQSLGYTVVDIKSWRTHHGVTFLANGKKHYLKFKHSTSTRKVVDWTDGTPEHAVENG